MALARWRRAVLSAVNSFSGGFIFVVGWVFVQALRLAALSLALSHGREDEVAVGMKASARKIKLCRLLFSCLALLLPLNYLHHFHKMRFQFGKQRIVFVFHHHFAHQLQPHGEALRHFGGEAFAFLHEADDVEDVVVIGRIKG